MDLSHKWLSEFVADLPIGREFDEAMTLSGSKVELTRYLGEEIQNVVVGQLLSMVRHPNSDHMWICQLEIGEDAPVQIVTGAQNLKENDLVPVAKDNSRLPGGIHITCSDLRGEKSQGMMCSMKELGLTGNDYPHVAEDGIFILSDDPELMTAGMKPGDDIRPLLGLDDFITEFEITPNRPDCLSVIGLAREAAATFQKELKLHEPVVKGTDGTSIADLLDVEIENPELCPRYTARMVRNVKIAPSPAWLRKRLRNSGVRPINNIVDITNYVMLEYGQPMHAFDFSCVEGGKIIVRTARDGEQIQTLDGNNRQLTPSMLCICDEHKPVGVAGVMGGANSEIIGDTAMVVFESANFNGVSIRRTATALGMRTDASSRYEKGLDPMNTYKGVQRACELVELLGCGEVVDGVIDVIASDQNPTTLKLEPTKINALLGTEVSESAMRDILLRLGFELDDDIIHVPSWRSDVAHYSDIAEEVARFYGYNNIPTTLMRGETTRGGLSDTQKAVRQAGSLCRALGYSEIMTYSFISQTAYDKIGLPMDSPLRHCVTILNPLGEDSSVMRTTALPSMLETLGRNHSYRNPTVKFYELATVYAPRANHMADEKPMLSLGSYGKEIDFFSLKGDLQALFASLGVTGERYTACIDNPSFHPGRCAIVSVDNTVFGMFGQIHPTIATNFGLDLPVFAAQIDFLALLSLRAPETGYQPLPRFPASTRDIAVVCDRTITVAQLTDCIKKASNGLLKQVDLFDIYMGTPIPENKKSVAFSLTLRSEDHTLNDGEIESNMQSILQALAQELGAVLR